MLERMEHRGACGCEINTGDGAGILCKLPHEFLSRAYGEATGQKLPALGEYAVGMLFMPRDTELREACRKVFEGSIGACGLTLLGWRIVPTDNSDLGKTALESEPRTEQCFLGLAEGSQSNGGNVLGDQTPLFEKKCYILRKRSHAAIHAVLARVSSPGDSSCWHWCSLSSRTIVYKGMLRSIQIKNYFADLQVGTIYYDHVAIFCFL